MCPCVKWLKLTYLLMMLYFRKYFKTCNFKLTCNLCSLVAFAACVQCETIKTDAIFFSFLKVFTISRTCFFALQTLSKVWPSYTKTTNLYVVNLLSCIIMMLYNIGQFKFFGKMIVLLYVLCFIWEGYYWPSLLFLKCFSVWMKIVNLL